MRHVTRKMLLFVMLPSLLLATAAWQIAPSLAQETAADGDKPASDGSKTVAVVSLASYDDMLQNVAFIGELLTGQPDMDQQAEMFIGMFTQGQGLAGLDKSKPSGAIVQANGDSIDVLIFLPINDVTQLLEVLTAFDVTSEEGDDGIFTVQARDQPEVFVQPKGSWAFVARSREALSAAPDDPQKLLNGLDEKYDVAVQFNVQNLPEMYRTMAIAALKEGVAEGLKQAQDEGGTESEARKQYAEALMSNTVSVITDTDQVTVGWSIDPEAKNTHLDVQVAAVPGSKLAKSLAASANVKTAFGGFVAPGGAITWTMSGKMAEDDIVQTLGMIEGARLEMMKRIDEDGNLPDDEARKVVKAAMGDVMDAVKATIEAGVLDAGGALTLSSDSLTLAGGGRVASTDKVEQALRNLAELGEKEDDFPGVEWNADKHGEIQFHTMQIPTRDDEGRRIFGDALDFTLGVGKDSLYFAVGKNGLAAIKTGIDKSSDSAASDQPPVAIRISLGQIMQFAAATSQDPQAIAMAQLFEGLDGNDHVSITATAGENSLTYRIELEEGVLQAIIQAGAAFNGGQALAF